MPLRLKLAVALGAAFLPGAAQEASTSVARRAGPARGWLALSVDQDELSLEIGDDGRDLNLESVDERVRVMGGRLEIESAPVAWTRLRPIPPPEAVAVDQRIAACRGTRWR